MSAERWKKIDRLLDEALELAPSERASFLDRACAGNGELRYELESLLAAIDRSSSFSGSLRFSTGDMIGGHVVPISGPPAGTYHRPLGPYRLLREIGRGGMGVVYLAIRADDDFKRQVAIKLVQPGPHNKDILWRFRRERQILAALDHPNIARLLDGGTTEDDISYLVMEYVAGKPLTEYCDERKLSITDRLRLFCAVCSVVQYAHQNFVIHRDLKPSNILVTAAGDVKLLDFGIAKLLDTDSAFMISEATTEVPLMTPEYASPEQIQGMPVTTASDVYALGIVLYELLTGHFPYRFKDRSLPEVLRVICEQEPEPPSRAVSRIATRTGSGGTPSTVSPDSVSRTREGKPEKLRARLRGDLSDIALMALRKDPRLRYGTVEQLSGDIQRHLEGRPVHARKATLTYRAGKFIRRYKTGAAVAAILLLTLLGGILATTRQASIARKEARDKRRLLYAAQMNMAAEAWDTTNIVRLRELVESQEPHSGEEDLRGFEWRYLWRLYHQNGERFALRHDIEVWAVAFSPDGKTLATGDDNGLLSVWDTVDGRLLTALRGHEKYIWSVAFSPDGRTLASGSGDSTIKLWDTTTWREITTLSGHTARVNAVAFSSDGKKLASGSDDYTARIWDVAGARELVNIRCGALRVRSIAFSPDGRMLAMQEPENQALALWDANTGAKLRPLEGSVSGAWALAFSPDGGRLAAGSRDRTARLWDVRTGKEILVFKAHGSEVRCVAFSPDGKMLATGSMDRSVKLWDLAGGSEVKTLKGHEGEIYSLAFSPDGKTLASASNDATVRLWDIQLALEPVSIKAADVMVALSPDSAKPSFASYSGGTVKLRDAVTGQPFASFARQSGAVTSAAFSPDGKIIATGDLRGSVKLWDTASQKEVTTVKAHATIVSSLAFAPDGQTLATASHDQTAKVWDVATGRLMLTLTGHDNRLYAVAFSPDGLRVATGSYDTTARLWDTRSGRELATLKGHSKPILCIAFSPDGKTLATGSADSTVKFWDAINGLEKATFSGHAGHVNSLAFSRDGKRLATGGDDGVVRLWDASGGQQVIALAGHTDAVVSVAFSPDGNTLVSGSLDGTIRLWRAAAP